MLGEEEKQRPKNREKKFEPIKKLKKRKMTKKCKKHQKWYLSAVCSAICFRNIFCVFHNI